MEAAKLLGVRITKFNEMVTDGVLPKGRLGEDSRRYYTEQDLRFMRREWKSKTTIHFMVYTLPIMLIVVFLILLTFREIGQSISEHRSQSAPTVPSGYGLQPQFPAGFDQATVIPQTRMTQPDNVTDVSEDPQWKEVKKQYSRSRNDKRPSRGM